MILLDTKVVSEPLRHAPAAGVVEWVDAHLDFRGPYSHLATPQLPAL